MHIRDKDALKYLHERVNPDTNRVDMTLRELSIKLGCSVNGITQITHRLERGGFIKKHRRGGRGGADIEVLKLE